MDRNVNWVDLNENHSFLFEPGSDADLFTVVLYNTYSPPPGFCFDVLCRDEAIVDDPDSADYNIDQRVHRFINRFLLHSSKK